MSERIRDRSNSDYDCPICMEFPSLMVETNCGHRFCAECFILHWKRTVYSRIISCPMCRGQIIDRIRDIPLFVYGFIQLLLSGEGTFALMQIRLTLLGLCVLFYLITPFDFIPDVVAGFLGILDDIIVLCIFTIHVVSVYQTISSRRELTR
ncbi:E3 ubiquitin-protein ligase [Schistosoma japonicum]|nr:E3 ubiquitin-protein ligase [Schistosoma japonicum]